jgi:hypothetical protein
LYGGLLLEQRGVGAAADLGGRFPEGIEQGPGAPVLAHLESLLGPILPRLLLVETHQHVDVEVVVMLLGSEEGDA